MSSHPRHTGLTVVPDHPPDDDTTRTPPNNPDAEQAVLGAILTQASTLTRVNDVIAPADFYQPRHELIFTAILQLAAGKAPIDVVSVAQQLTSTKDLNRAGGASYLHTLIAAVTSPATAPYYARIVADHAAARRLVQAGTKITELGYSGASDVDAALTRASEVYQAATTERDAGTTSTWQPVPLEDYLYGNALDSVPPSILHRTDGAALLYASAVHSVSGEPGSGKSWVAILACKEEIDAGRDVAYLDFEDRPARVTGRLLAAGANPAQVEQHFRYIRPEQALNPTTAGHLEHAVAGTTLAILDGVTEAMTMHGLSLLDNEDVARFIALLPRRVADLGPAVLQIDHVVKNTEARGRYAIGGQHKLAALDGCAYKLVVTEPFGRGKRGHANLILDKDREGHVQAIALGQTVARLTLDARDTDTHTREQLRVHLDPPSDDTGPDGTFRPTGLMERVSRYLEVNPGTIGGDVERAVKGKAQYTRAALHALTVEGYLRTEPAPRSATRYWSVRAYREGDE